MIAAIERVLGLVCMSIRVLHMKVLVEHWVVIVEPGQVEAGLGSQAMMGKVRLAMLYCLSSLGL